MRKAFFIVNFAVLGLFIAAVVQDQLRPWKFYQRAYYRKTVEHLSAKLSRASAEEKASLENQIADFRKKPLYIRQIISQDLGFVDRCVTCHVGMDEYTNPSLKNDFTENPYKSHPGDLHKKHPFSKYGCTSCHEGQGLALTFDAAKGRVKHWERPMLKPPHIESACLKCHGDFKTLAQTATAARGLALFEENGCIGCHSVRGTGGSISVDLGDVADKPLSRIDFSYTGLAREDWTVGNWIKIHLTKDPMEVAPNDPEGHLGEPIAPSGMPPFYKKLSREDAQAVTTYLLSMTARSVPREYYRYVPPEKEPSFPTPLKRGEHVFRKYGCAACHGPAGSEGQRNFNALGVNQTRMDEGRVPTLVKTVGTYTRPELKDKISAGVSAMKIVRFHPKGPVPPLYMPAWKDRIKGPELEDLATYLLSISEKGEEW